MQEDHDAHGRIDGFSSETDDKGPFIPANVVFKDFCEKKRKAAARATERRAAKKACEREHVSLLNNPVAGAEVHDTSIDPRQNVLKLVGVTPSSRILDDSDDDGADLGIAQQPSTLATTDDRLKKARAAVDERKTHKKARTVALASLSMLTSNATRADPLSKLVIKMFADATIAEMAKAAGEIPHTDSSLRCVVRRVLMP